ncbi:MAG: sigma 54-dependent Fis family transcriptional regulator [Polyangiaceae bacterium]|nr:sigma 54-dependent Fis family transcriptional regulator [Polyangiaceae bacterium]
MNEEPRSGTVALKLPDAMPVRTLVVTVREGPDQGATWEGEQGTVGTAHDNDLVLRDGTVSGYHLRLGALKHGVQVSDFGSTNGTTAGGMRIEKAIVPPGTALTMGRTILVVTSGRPATVELHDEDRLGDLRGGTAAMRRLMSDIRRVAQSNVPVLLIGESGTGKELLARGIHDASPRAKKPFITVDCGSLTPTLVASELFGHEQGAFTGANKLKRGAFEHADGGTLFLDEIGELPAELQTNLLGALERKRFCRVGGHTEIEVDVRVVAATNRDLRAEVNAGTFRLDLYYRLAVVTLAVPPLRERAEDIPLLLEHFAREEGLTAPLSEIIPEATMTALMRHRWPGNVRELRNYVQATLAMGEPAVLREERSPENTAELARGFESMTNLPYGEARRVLLNEFEAVYVKALLERTHGNVARAAREGEMARSHLNELLRRHNLRGTSG